LVLGDAYKKYATASTFTSFVAYLDFCISQEYSLTMAVFLQSTDFDLTEAVQTHILGSALA